MSQPPLPARPRVLTTVAATRAAVHLSARPLGLVPTMGALHQGHLSLVRRARLHCATVVVSVFVNPAQFGPGEDFAAYPRDTERDLALLRQEGVDLVFLPAVEEVYPPGFDTAVVVGGVAEPLEGAARPGHFRGVATVVAKLFNLVQPDRAYFGQKDAQQVAVIRKMVADLALPIEIVGLPIVREPDGLALSSRNVYLSAEERQAARVLRRSLQTAEHLFAGGERHAPRIQAAVLAALSEEPLARAEYVSVADPETLQELGTIPARALVAMAVRVGNTRLIDNVELGAAM